MAAPVPQSRPPSRPLRKDFAHLQLQDSGRNTPLPQYEKTPSVPFTLTLQEEKENPGQFQLVVNIDPQYQKPAEGSSLRPAASKKLIANLKEVPSLGYDVSPLYHTQKSSPPSTPHDEKQGWSDLDAIPPEFLQKVVPDWKVTFSRSDSTASSQSRKLADIKARIKKSGKGFVVRLLKGSSADNNEVAEVHLGPKAYEHEIVSQELDSHPRLELDATEQALASANQSSAFSAQPTVFEIGTSSEPGIQKAAPPPPVDRSPAVTSWLNQVTSEPSRRASVLEEGFSDAETLIPDFRSIADRLEEQTDIEPFSRSSSVVPTRSGSVSSIVKTPTRGLSVVGPVRRVDKASRIKAKGKAARPELNRAGARKSVKRNSAPSPPDSTISEIVSRSSHRPSVSFDMPGSRFQDHSDTYGTKSGDQNAPASKSKGKRRSSSEAPLQAPKARPRQRLHPLDTNVSRPSSTHTSPVARRRRCSRNKSSSSSPINGPGGLQADASPVWSEIDPAEAEKMREALEEAFGTVADDVSSIHSIPKIEEPPNEADTEEPLPPEYEIQSGPILMSSPMTTFWGLALSALTEKVFQGIQTLRDTYGSEPPVPPNHVRVRWTCSCGERLYDDFIERKPGAARFLEGYLNRPRAHTPPDSSQNPRTHAPPTSPASRSSTSTSLSSIFGTASRASTLTTPESTYAGAASWNRKTTAQMYSPTRSLSFNSFPVKIADESWLLTCANEGRFTPKVVHLDVNTGKIKSDKDLALALRDHYERLNRRWLGWARLRGLTTIEFVQFEVHRNRFADIRATPSMPPVAAAASEKAPSPHPYSFEPVDLMPPVGSAYLLHLFRHPEDYDGELITYLRSPKRRERLETGMGWGINLVEGFLAQKVWAVVMACFGIGSAVFAAVWTIQKRDVQGAFGVAGWVVTLAGLVLGGLQAWLD